MSREYTPTEAVRMYLDLLKQTNPSEAVREVIAEIESELRPDPARTVYVVETGDCEERHVFCVAASISAAVQHIRDTYEDPFVVRWEEPTSPSIGDCVEFVGHFAAVPGYSTKHVSTFSIVPEEVVGCERPLRVGLQDSEVPVPDPYARGGQVFDVSPGAFVELRNEAR